MSTEAELVAAAKAALVALVDAEHAVVWSEVEAKLSEEAYAGYGKGHMASIPPRRPDMFGAIQICPRATRLTTRSAAPLTNLDFLMQSRVGGALPNSRQNAAVPKWTLNRHLDRST